MIQALSWRAFGTQYARQRYRLETTQNDQPVIEPHGACAVRIKNPTFQRVTPF
jgi:hypothetical protein